MIFDPVMQALALKARGEPVPEHLMDDAAAAVIASTCALLRRNGVSEAAIDDMFERPFEVRLGWQPGDDEVSASVVFLDGDDIEDVPVIRA